MSRLHIVAEGQTEENFVRQLLAPVLGEKSIFTDARCVLTSEHKGKTHRGGLSDYEKPKKDILQWIKQESKPENYFSTMFDLYALPNDFPGYKEAQTILDPYEKVAFLEQELEKDIVSSCNLLPGHFIPYIQLHEFEALILADAQKLDFEYPESKYKNAIKNLTNLVEEQDDNPELVNQGRETAPSKRILKEIPTYDKSLAGVSVLQQITIPVLRERCKHFQEWLLKLESLEPLRA